MNASHSTPFSKNFWWGVLAGVSGAIILFFILMQSTALKTSLFFNLGGLGREGRATLEIGSPQIDEELRIKTPNKGGDCGWGDDAMRKERDSQSWGDDAMRKERDSQSWGDDAMRKERDSQSWGDDAMRKERDSQSWGDDAMRKERF